MPDCTTGNTILDFVAQMDGDALQPLLASADYTRTKNGAVLQKAGEPIQFTYFPVSGLLSLALILEDGSEVNTIGIGRDGVVNAQPQINLDCAAHAVVVQLSGEMMRLPAKSWQDFLETNGRARNLLTRYADYLLSCSHHALACQTKHDVESRLCRWLLDIHRWQSERPIEITHHRLARLLGVRRTTVTLIAERLEDAGIIACRRGVMEITDPYALEQASCECHKFRNGWYEWLQMSATPH